MSVTLILPHDSIPLTDTEDMVKLLGTRVDVIIDGGYCGYESTTIIDLVGDVPLVVRQGKGDTSFLTENKASWFYFEQVFHDIISGRKAEMWLLLFFMYLSLRIEK